MNIQHRNKKFLFLDPKSLILNRGFTLIELLVVISIIGILIAMSIFGLSELVKQQEMPDASLIYNLFNQV